MVNFDALLVRSDNQCFPLPELFVVDEEFVESLNRRCQNSYGSLPELQFSPKIFKTPIGFVLSIC